MASVAILGSGFGLYGYLPAMIAAGIDKIILPERYRGKFAARPELASFANRIDWTADEAAALARADSLVMALKPELQVQRIQESLAKPGLSHLLLEKPLAPDPAAAQAIFDALTSSGKNFRIGYLFRMTPWGMALLKDMRGNNGGLLKLSWNFMAHHYRHASDTWKRDHSAGGGALRFYGIHVIALLAELGYSDIRSSKTAGTNANDVSRWSAVFTGTNLPDFHVDLDSRSETRTFTVGLENGKTFIANQADPFDSNLTAGELDQRVPLLTTLCRSLWQDLPGIYKIYGDTIRLWAATEARTRFETMTPI